MSNRKFTREYTDHTGRKSVWTYDLDKFPNGPVKTEYFYPKSFDSPDEDDPTSESIPKTKRKYLNPENGKLVGYTRAVQLGLIK